MGAQFFQQFESCEGPTDTLAQAFQRAQRAAQYQHGHGGYSGSLADKHDATLIAVANGTDDVQGVLHGPVDYETAVETAHQLTSYGDPRIDDKWGPAGAIRVKSPLHDGWLFFGVASS